jgi:hypothetical protein
MKLSCNCFIAMTSQVKPSNKLRPKELLHPHTTTKGGKRLILAFLFLFGPAACERQQVYFGCKLSYFLSLLLVNTASSFSLQVKDNLIYTCRSDGFINCYNLTSNDLLRTFEGFLSNNPESRPRGPLSSDCYR